MKIEVKYFVNQGLINKRGNGNLSVIGVFKKLKDAQALFNDIKNDNTGWANYSKGSCVDTYIEKYYFDGDEIVKIDTIDYYSIELKGGC